MKNTTLNYRTDKLPPIFIFLGLFLLIVGVWRVLLSDWFGIVLLVISFFCLFIRWGILIDTDKKRLKKYSGCFGIKKGDWVDIITVEQLEISTRHETQNMGVASISRSATNIVYQLFFVLPSENILLMKGKRDLIFKVAEEISNELNLKVINELG